MADHTDHQVLRICHVAMGDLWAGAEVQLTALVDTLAKRPDLELSVVLFNEGRLAAELRTLGVSVTVFSEAKLRALTLLRELTAYCRSGRFDLLHTHKYKDTILGTIAAARCGIPYVVRTVHGLTEPFRGIQSFRMGLYELCEDLAVRLKVDRLIAVSSQIEQVLSRKYDLGKVVRIHNGIRIGHIPRMKTPQEIRQQLGMESSHYLIGTVGRLTAVKGHEHFLAGAQRLLRHRRDLRFVIVGDGPLLNDLKGKARDLNIADHVTFLGHRDDTYDLMGTMDIFVLPSLHEGIPMVILEAMALARPIVASRVGGIPEVITDFVHGLLIPAADPEELAEGCRKFLDDRCLAERCGKAGQLRVQEEFSAESMAAKVAALYFELVEGVCMSGRATVGRQG
jgi:glycosyltransferase involved in cell wall biosynthesis